MYFLIALFDDMSAITTIGNLSSEAPKYWSTRSSVWGTCTCSSFPRCCSATCSIPIFSHRLSLTLPNIPRGTRIFVLEHPSALSGQMPCPLIRVLYNHTNAQRKMTKYSGWWKSLQRINRLKTPRPKSAGQTTAPHALHIFSKNKARTLVKVAICFSKELLPASAMYSM